MATIGLSIVFRHFFFVILGFYLQSYFSPKSLVYLPKIIKFTKNISNIFIFEHLFKSPEIKLNKYVSMYLTLIWTFVVFFSLIWIFLLNLTFKERRTIVRMLIRKRPSHTMFYCIHIIETTAIRFPFDETIYTFV